MLFFYLYLVWFISSCYAEKEQEKIFGGRLALKGEFPSAVAVLSGSICGGTLFALDKVLTAAHCMANEKTGIPNPIEKYKIYGGTLKIPIRPKFQTGEGAQIRKISTVKIHEGFKRKNDGSSYYDIAFVSLTEPFVESATLSVAKFRTKNEKDFFDAWKDLVSSGRKCIGVGWGATAFRKINKTGKIVPAYYSDVLKATEFIPLDQISCKGYNWEEDEDMTEKGEVCVCPNVDKGESACSGDSGSPLYCDGYAFALARAFEGCGRESTAQFYLLFGHFFDYFGIGTDKGFLLSTEIYLVLIFSTIALRNKA